MRRVLGTGMLRPHFVSGVERAAAAAAAQGSLDKVSEKELENEHQLPAKRCEKVE